MSDRDEHALVAAISDRVDELAIDHDPEALAPLLEQRAHDLAPDAPGRAAWLSHAGEYWEIAEEPERALSCYDEALAHGGPTWIDVRASLVGVLLGLGDEPRADALLDELRQDLAKGPLHGPVQEYVGEKLEAHDRPEDALQWFSAGVLSAERDGDEAAQSGNLDGRFRVRRSLGLPLDDYDELSLERRRGFAPAVDSRPGFEDDLTEPAPRREPPLRLTLLYWPAQEFDRLLTRWPEMAEEYGEEHAEHRGLVERHLRKLDDEGVRASVSAGCVEEYVEFATDEDKDPAEDTTRANYAARLGAAGRIVAWPPGRNAPCWCGSGTKYKKCCGGLRFSTDAAP
jgi:tetratricopeptide (TPR) repeat protein